MPGASPLGEGQGDQHLRQTSYARYTTDMVFTAPTGRKIGYARVSTEDQDCNAQRQALKKDGCKVVHADTMSGMKAQRPELGAALAALRPGDTLVVYKLDRLGRDYVNLGILVRDLVARGVHLRSLSEQLDTSTAAGNMMLGIISVFANYERDVIVERTNLGLAAARERGAVFGNPRMKARDPQTIARLKATWHAKGATAARERSKPWIDLVRRHRPNQTWHRVNGLIERETGDKMSLNTLRSSCQRLVEAGELEPRVMDRTPARGNESAAVVAQRIAKANPDLSLREIGRELDRLGVAPARAASWSAASVALMLDRRTDQGSE